MSRELREVSQDICSGDGATRSSRVISYVEGGTSGRDTSDGNEAKRVSQAISGVEGTPLGFNSLDDDIPGRDSSVDDTQVDLSGGYQRVWSQRRLKFRTYVLSVVRTVIFARIMMRQWC